jgi:hypothetical protein
MFQRSLLAAYMFRVLAAKKIWSAQTLKMKATSSSKIQ